LSGRLLLAGCSIGIGRQVKRVRAEAAAITAEDTKLDSRKWHMIKAKNI
jgi:hypothetical protein